ncbi:MAG: Holliday junction branch migration protein RuvA [Lachnospiraceae bacterium]
MRRVRYIKGILTEADDQGIVLENNGIGFYIFVPAAMFAGSLPMGEEIRIYTYLNVKMMIMGLHGFLTRDDLEVFRLLLGSQRGGASKAGLGILSALSADELRFAVLSDDAAAIAKAPGIGKKTAQKLILELKDKLDLEEAFEQKLSHQAESELPRMEDDGRREAVQALTALGYSSTDALRAVKQVEGAEQMNVETLLKAALKKMV